MDRNINNAFDILPPPLEKISRERSKNMQKNEKKINKKEEKEEVNEDVKEGLKEKDVFNYGNENKGGNATPAYTKNMNLGNGLTDGKKNESHLISQKYSNVILNTEEINSIMNENSNFKNLTESKQVINFMNEYLTNPLAAINKYKNDDTIVNFLDTLFQYMSAKSKHIHLNNLAETFTLKKR
ncbi:hypothetical protein MKS88_002115 [Plasmodium brasilianum]|uniref:Uncharacterized protein n=2 Tax=Plasmodium (Plasmodium) TaxID=418103 RepID=A0A1A8WRI6_PLAMA|nr:conserved Plasmodium protein, unknown function [Plasmodium malariae]KAI4839558.1 hypothetical protein MKS88_002115 [Plasmodium brasilianum]SBS93930.1 hypothetical protein PMALA_041490 [Plasmodium malariae]SBT87984.1 conserved Plasmodium protein, unknown function [Plasmodium malariae]